MRPLRVLLVGYLDRKGLQARWYNTERKLAYGFVRAGHAVLCFSDRDEAREATPLRSQRWGARRMARRLVETARHLRPHLVLFGHVDLLGAEDFAAIRAASPGARLAAFCVDAVSRGATMAAFAARAAAMDACFLTTADPAALAPFGFPPGRLFFMPNPVDAAIETGRAFDLPRDRLAHDGLFLGTGIGTRQAQLDALRAALPAGYRFLDGGRHRSAGRLSSTAFLETLASAGAGPVLPLDDRDPALIHRLYASDRIAQLLGQGLAALTPAPAGFEALYGDGVLPYADRAGLAEAMARLSADDARRRALAGAGWRAAHARTASAQVAGFIAAVALGETPPPVAWPDAPLT